MKNDAYEIALNPKYDGYQGALGSMMYNIFDEKTVSGAIATSKAGANENEVLVQELHIPAIKKFKTRKVYAWFKDNIWAADLAEMGSLSSRNGGVKYLWCVIDFFPKYVWVKPVTDKKAKRVLNVLLE